MITLLFNIKHSICSEIKTPLDSHIRAKGAGFYSACDHLSHSKFILYNIITHSIIGIAPLCHIRILIETHVLNMNPAHPCSRRNRIPVGHVHFNYNKMLGKSQLFSEFYKEAISAHSHNNIIPQVHYVVNKRIAPPRRPTLILGAIHVRLLLSLKTRPHTRVLNDIQLYSKLYHVSTHLSMPHHIRCVD